MVISNLQKSICLIQIKSNQMKPNYENNDDDNNKYY